MKHSILLKIWTALMLILVIFIPVHAQFFHIDTTLTSERWMMSPVKNVKRIVSYDFYFQEVGGRFSYDTLNYKKEIYRYDITGNEIEHSTETSRGEISFKVTNEYDQNGRKIRSTHFNKEEDSYQFSTYQYNDFGTLSKIHVFNKNSALKGYETYQYQSNGNLVTETVSYFDSKSQLTKKTINTYYKNNIIGQKHIGKNNKAEQGIYDFKLKSNGKLAQASYFGKVTYYDDQERVTSIASFDENNKRTSYETYKYGSNSLLAEVTNYDYFGKLFSKTNYFFDGNKFLTKKVSQQYQLARDETNEYLYDDHGNPFEEKWTDDQEGYYSTAICKNDFTYDNHGNWTKVIQWIDGRPQHIYFRQIEYWVNQMPQSELSSQRKAIPEPEKSSETKWKKRNLTLQSSNPNINPPATDTYEGETGNGQRNGNGRMYFSNGDYYEGTWQSDMIHGRGIMFYKSGNKYYGEWKSGLKEGQGKILYKDGSSFEGLWVNDAIGPSGNVTWPDGRNYTGELVNAQMEGKGVYTKGNTILEGTFKNGVLNGYGTHKSKSDAGDLEETGLWMNGELHGQAMMTVKLKDGSTVEKVGEFKTGQLYNGYEKTYLRDGRKYVKMYKNGVEGKSKPVK